MTTSKAVLKPAATGSLLSRFNPLQTERRRLLHAVVDILDADHAESEDRKQQMLDAMDPTERAVFESMDDLAASTYSDNRPVSQQVKSQLFRFSNATLERIVDAYDNGNHDGASWFIKKHMNSGDISLREAVFFREELGNTEDWFRALDDLRLSHKDFMLEDLTEMDEQTHARASVVLFICLEVYEEVIDHYADAPTPAWTMKIGRDVQEYTNRESEPMLRMAPELIEVVFKHIGRVDEITDYIIERCINDNPVSPAHLDDYLSLPAKSLGGGVL